MSDNFDVEVPDIPLPEEEKTIEIEDTFKGAFKFAIIGAGGATGLQPGNSALNWLDSPATTSSTTYTIYHRVAPTASGTVTSRIFTDSYAGSITVMEIKG